MNILDSTTKIILAGTSASVALLATWVVSDYQAWKAFGTGGTPPTPSGYWRMTKLRLFRIRNSLNKSKTDMKDVSMLDASGPSYLKVELPDKSQHRPKVVSRIMPQRQTTEDKHKIDYDTKARLFALPEKYTYSHPKLLYLDLSATEGYSADAIYAHKTQDLAQDRILKNEIAHVHPAENSLHVWLSEADAKTVVEKGWGERFPLSAMGMCHKGWTFVYAPRSMDDVDVIDEIVKAGCAFVTGERLR